MDTRAEKTVRVIWAALENERVLLQGKNSFASAVIEQFLTIASDDDLLAFAKIVREGGERKRKDDEKAKLTALTE